MSKELVERIDALLSGAAVDDTSVSPDAMRSIPEDQAQHPFGEVIDAYTRAQAIEDGVLVAADPAVASDAGFRVPVALTRAAWEGCVAWTDADSARQVPQDETGRLFDVLLMAVHGIRRTGRNRATFEVYRVPRGGRARAPRPVQLAVALGFGDHGEPVATVMEPHED